MPTYTIKDLEKKIKKEDKDKIYNDVQNILNNKDSISSNVDGSSLESYDHSSYLKSLENILTQALSRNELNIANQVKKEIDKEKRIIKKVDKDITPSKAKAVKSLGIQDVFPKTAHKDKLYSIKNRLVKEELLLEELPKEIVRKIYGKDYIEVSDFISGSLPRKTSVYKALRDECGIDIYRSSFTKVEKKDFLQAIKTAEMPNGSIVCGDYKGTSVVFINPPYSGWYRYISIDSSKIKRWDKHSIEAYFSSYKITKQRLADDTSTVYYAVKNKLDNVDIFVCDGSSYERNFKPKITDKAGSLQREFNKILLDHGIDLDQVDSSIEHIFDIRTLFSLAYYQVPYYLSSRYLAWENYVVQSITNREMNGYYDLNDLNKLRKKLTDAKKEFKLDPSTKNKRNLLKLKKEVKTANNKYLNSTIDEKNHSYFDSLGCYFILKAFIKEIKKLNSAIGTTWGKSNKGNSAIKDLSQYINALDTFQTHQLRDDDFGSLSSISEWGDINKKVKDTLSEALKKAQELLDKIKDSSDTDIEYSILNLTVALVENLKYKLQTILRLKQSMKEDLNEDSNINEDIEKHDTLNPKLFDENNELKEDVKEAIENIVQEFLQELATDGVRFSIKDIVLVGSNVSYNYTKDSDLDVHIIMDEESLDCNPEVYTLLYGAYRTMFNKNYDITVKGVPIELYVQLV